MLWREGRLIMCISLAAPAQTPSASLSKILMARKRQGGVYTLKDKFTEKDLDHLKKTRQQQQPEDGHCSYYQHRHKWKKGNISSGSPQMNRHDIWGENVWLYPFWMTVKDRIWKNKPRETSKGVFWGNKASPSRNLPWGILQYYKKSSEKLYGWLFFLINYSQKEHTAGIAASKDIIYLP